MSKPGRGMSKQHDALGRPPRKLLRDSVTFVYSLVHHEASDLVQETFHIPTLARQKTVYNVTTLPDKFCPMLHDRD